MSYTLNTLTKRAKFDKIVVNLGEKMIATTECFGFSITDDFGALDRDYQSLLTQEEIDHLNSANYFRFNHESDEQPILDEPCIVYQHTVEAPWLVIGISGRFPRSYSQDDLVKMVEEAIAKSSPIMQSIYKKITDVYEIKFEDLTIAGEI